MPSRSSLRILHLPFTFPPDPSGGTEVYVEHLARGQRRAGHEPLVGAPTAGPERSYEREGVPVRRYPVARTLSLRDLHGEGDALAAAGVERIVAAARPDLVHLHAFTSATSVRLARRLDALGLPIVVTYHTPTMSCARGTLLRWGREPCDGRLDALGCSACVLESRGVPRGLAPLAARASTLAGPLLARREGGRAFTALRMTELVALRHDALRELLRLAGRVITLTGWSTRLLATIGVDERKVRQVRHGLVAEPPPPAPPPPPRPLRVAFLGRLAPEKAPDLLVRALRFARGDVRLDLYGTGDPGGSPYARELARLASADDRVRLLPPVPHADVLPTLQRYHLVAVPSRWFETGPFVALEAFGAGVPVLGTRLGGLADWITHEVDGLLLPLDDARAWGEALDRLAASPALVESLRAAVRPPPSFESSVVPAVERIYRELLGPGAEPA